MANIIGEPLDDYVVDQINARQTLHGSGVRDVNRTPTQINLLNSKTAWVKLASGISVDASRLVEVGLSPSLANMELAKHYVLHAGISKIGKSPNGFTQLQQREGFLPQQGDSSYTYGSYGYSPMPGLISADIKTLNRGSLKKATVKLVVNNKEQFNIIDLLYLRLGYTVLLEWGHSIYTTDGVDREVVRNTLTEDFFFSTNGKGSYLDMLGPIDQTRSDYAGNYDALLGKVSNFNWSFKEDGSYDIELTIISLGDVVESLKTNISIDTETRSFFQQQSPPSSPTQQPAEPDPIEENKDANILTSMLYLWKYINPDISLLSPITIVTPNDTHNVGGILSNIQGNNSNTITTTYTPIEYTVLYYDKSTPVRRHTVTSKQDKYFSGKTKTTTIASGDPSLSKQVKFDSTYFSQVWAQKEEIRKKYEPLTPNSGWLKGKIGITSNLLLNKTTTTSIANPLLTAPPGSAIAFNTIPNPQYYLKFGYLLQYVRDNVLPRVKTGNNHDENPPIFEIDYDLWSNHMYSLPNQISLDPRVCVVRNDNFITEAPESTNVFQELDVFKEIDNGSSTNDNAAYPMNIYLNFNFIIECLKPDERGDVNVFEFIKAICDGLNKSLGGINNLEPIIDETSNTLKIVDSTPIPGYSSIDGTSPYTLQLYGYDKTSKGYISNFVRNVDLKTAITPEFATMITVGATAGGYVKGTEATAFSKWNVGLVDRFKEEFTPGSPSSVKPAGGADEAETNYVEKIIRDGYAKRYGFTTLNSGFIKISDDIIEGNISIGTEYFKYLIAQKKNDSGGTIGFIPFKLSFTMDGLSGIKIYNKLNVDTRFLPRAYGDNLDLIVTGVSHKLANNDWETDIEATVIPKSKGGSTPLNFQTVQQSISQIGGKNNPKISTCSELPSATGLSNSARKIIKSTSSQKDAVAAIINHLEGGYFHPSQAWSSFPKTIKPGFVIMKDSGETIYGIDRVAGGWMKSPKGKAFWAKIDKLSGYGKYSSENSVTVTRLWDISKFPSQSKGWGYNYMPNTSTILNEAKDMIEERFNSYLNANFNGHPLKNIILNDGRLLFMWYRATWNGSGFFANYASNLKRIYNAGQTNIDKLICADLTYRYNTKKSSFKPGVSKMSYMMDYNPS